MRVSKRLYLTADKKHVVEGGKRAAYLYKAKYQEITKKELNDYPELKKYIYDDKPIETKMKKPANNKMGKKPEDK